MSKRIGFIGMGRMGAPMSGRLIEAGLPLAVYNRSPEKLGPLLQMGARASTSAAALARESDLVISMLADGAALLDVVLGPEGILAGASRGLIFADMSTVGPAESARVAEACAAAGIQYLRAPVSGSTMAATAGTLGIIVSGPRSAYDEAADVLKLMGQQPFYLGSGEEARVMKLALNMMVGVTMAVFAEALVMGEKAGLDWRQMLEVFTQSALASPLVKYKAPNLAERNFGPAFTVRLMGKDFDLALETARQLDVAVPTTALVRQLLQATAGSGWSEQDFSALVLLLEQAAGIRPGS